MYAKLFSRIVQSSLMEQSVEVRYCFMMLLAIADPHGYVIGTDIAVARSLNLPLDVFQTAIEALMSPDPDSNSKEHEGRRVIESDAGRGYFIVNYTTYRAIKTDEEKRTYMREYMRKRRNTNSVTAVKICKNVLSDVTQAESESESESEKEAKTQKSHEAGDGFAERIYEAYPRKVARADALRAIAKAMKKINPDKLLGITIAYAVARKDADPKFTPHPATWFNSERFNDEPESWNLKAIGGTSGAAVARLNRYQIQDLRDERYDLTMRLQTEEEKAERPREVARRAEIDRILAAQTL